MYNETATEKFILTPEQEIAIYDLAQAVIAEHSGYQVDIAEKWVDANTLTGRFSEAEIIELEEMGLIKTTKNLLDGDVLGIMLSIQGADFYDNVISKLW